MASLPELARRAWESPKVTVSAGALLILGGVAGGIVRSESLNREAERLYPRVPIPIADVQKAAEVKEAFDAKTHQAVAQAPGETIIFVPQEEAARVRQADDVLEASSAQWQNRGKYIRNQLDANQTREIVLIMGPALAGMGLIARGATSGGRRPRNALPQGAQV